MSRDPLSKSEQMSRVRNRNTKPEQRLRKALWHAGIRYRLNQKALGTKPDLVFRGKKVAVFIDGCFWHGCPEHYTRPKTRPEFWAQKLGRNVERDVEQTKKLESEGWRVIRLWEHTAAKNVEEGVRRVQAALNDETWNPPRSWRAFRADSSPEHSCLTLHLLRLRAPDVRKVVQREVHSGTGSKAIIT